VWKKLWLAYSYAQSVKERVGKLREEIRRDQAKQTACTLQGGKKIIGASDQERRLQRLQEIMDELMSLTDWKKNLTRTSLTTTVR